MNFFGSFNPNVTEYLAKLLDGFVRPFTDEVSFFVSFRYELLNKRDGNYCKTITEGTENRAIVFCDGIGFPFILL